MTGEVLNWLEGPAAGRLLAVLGHFCWQGAAVWAAAVLVGRGLAGRSAGVRYRAELTAFGLLCMCPAVTWGVSGSDGGGGSVVRGEAHAKPRAVAPDGESIPTLPAGGGGSPAEPAVLPSAPPVGEVAVGPHVPRLSAWVLGLYGVEVCVGGLRLVAGAAGVAALKRSLVPVSDDVTDRAAELAGRPGLRRAPRVGFSRWARAPCAAGWVRPAVVLPLAWAGRVPPEVLDAALAHELAHLRAGDVWVNLVQRLAETVLFYHPAVWVLSGRVRSARELCRDADAARALGDAAAVARGLEFAASFAAPPRRRGALFCPPFGDESMPVLSRVNALLGRPPVRRSPASSALPAAVVLSLPALWWPGAALAEPPVPAEPAAEPDPAADPAVPAVDLSPAERAAFLRSIERELGTIAGGLGSTVEPLGGPGKFEVGPDRENFPSPTASEPGWGVPFMREGPSFAFASFSPAGNVTVVDTGEELIAWNGVRPSALLASLTARERASLAHRLAEATPEGSTAPPQVDSLIDLLVGVLPAAEADAAEPRSLGPSRGPNRARNPTAEDDLLYSGRFDAGAAALHLGPSAARGWEFWRRADAGAVPTGDAERLFESTVLPAARRGDEVPAYILRFWERNGIERAAARVSAATAGEGD